MRVLAALLLLLPLAACVAPDDASASGMPVVEITTKYERTIDGHPWEPPYPGHEGCPDTFQIDPSMHKVRLYARTPAPNERTKAAISVPPRDPEAYETHPQLALPESLPHRVILWLGNEGSDSTMLLVDRGHVSFDGMELIVDEPLERTFHYTYKANNGTMLAVTERMTAHYFGDWQDPVTFVEDRGCD